jgi:hypothetical protein
MVAATNYAPRRKIYIKDRGMSGVITIDSLFGIYRIRMA